MKSKINIIVILFFLNTLFLSASPLSDFIESSSRNQNSLILSFIKEGTLSDSIEIFETLNLRNDFNIAPITKEIFIERHKDNEVKLLFLTENYFVQEPMYTKVLENYQDLLYIFNHITEIKETSLRKNLYNIAVYLDPNDRRFVIMDGYSVLNDIIRQNSRNIPYEYWGEIVSYSYLCAADKSGLAKTKLATLLSQIHIPQLSKYIKPYLSDF